MSNKKRAISQIREFNRFYTPLIGILDKNYLDSGYSVTENRILFELSESNSVTAKYLCDLLFLDKGYISRVISKFEKNGLITREASSHDGRSQFICLTEKGKIESERLISITDKRIGELIADLTDEDIKTVCYSMGCIIKKLSVKAGDDNE